jgi:hypothetical protein
MVFIKFLVAVFALAVIFGGIGAMENGPIFPAILFVVGGFIIIFCLIIIQRKECWG